ncbi:hypothetical protein V4B64_08480 [Klebsiella pneumoniae]
MKAISKLLISLIFSSASVNAFASPTVFFDEVTHTAGFTVLDDIPKKGSNCSLNEGLLTVTGGQYSKSGRYIELIKVKRNDGVEFAIPTNFEKLNNEDISNSQDLISKGGVVYLRFSTCGSGGYMSLIDILKPL